MSARTPGPWVQKYLGGVSTVLTDSRPHGHSKNTPTYGFVENGQYCLGAVFQDEENKFFRRDFVTFSHADARLIAAAPDLLAALKALLDTQDMVVTRSLHQHDAACKAARAAIAKATQS